MKEVDIKEEQAVLARFDQRLEHMTAHNAHHDEDEIAADIEAARAEIRRDNEGRSEAFYAPPKSDE